MPNWCNNEITITHADASKLQELASAVNNGDFCNHIIPVPQELQGTTSPTPKEADPEEARRLVEKYGASNWYDFCVKHWGTKWDIALYTKVEAVVEGGELRFGFDTAWTPPTGVYEEMIKLGFSVTAYYYEQGVGFCGVWENGDDKYFDIGGMSSDRVRKTIPESLDQCLGVSENIANYEESQ